MKTISSHTYDGETIHIRQYPNGRFYIVFDLPCPCTSGPYDTLEQAQAAFEGFRPESAKYTA